VETFSLVVTIIFTLLGFGAYIHGKRKDAKLEAELIKYRSKKLREEIDNNINLLDNEILDRRAAYEKAKTNVYDLVKRINDTNGKKPDDK